MNLGKMLGQILSRKLSESDLTKTDIERSTRLHNKTVTKVFDGSAPKLASYEKVAAELGCEKFKITES